MAAEAKGVYVLCFIAFLNASSDAALSTETSRDSHLLLRSDKEAQGKKLFQGRPVHGRRAEEAREAIEGSPHVRESSWADASVRMPGFIERHPLFYTSFFVLSGVLVLAGVCVYVHLEDLKEARKKQRRATSIFERHIPEVYAQRGVLASRPPHSTLEDERLPLMRRAQAPTVSDGGGEPPRLPKFATWRSQESTSASGDLSPRSNAPSQGSSSDSIRPPISIIRSGTVLMARVPEVVFASPTSWREIGELSAGQEVVAAGAPEMVDDYTMVPIRPRGAVDLKVLEVLRGRQEE
jgi:hypothetical protein